MKSGHTCESVSHSACDMNLNHRLTLTSCTFKPQSECLEVSERLCKGSSDQSGLENFKLHCKTSEVHPDRVTVTAEDDSRSLGSSTVEDEDRLAPEIQQAHRIFQSFLSEKHKATTAPFWHLVCPGSHWDQASDGEMCFKKMEEKFVKGAYESITAFVADFRLMLENCYRSHGVHHWMSKQAQKLEVILEQKLTLLSRTLREKTTLAVTSGGRFGTEDEKAPAGSSSRRRSVPRNLAAITVGGSESILLQALRLEELQRAKEEKRRRELERKESEEVSTQELEDWECSLLSLAEPWSVHSTWELPAIGHFLCLAQTALNLPEIVFYELERCLLMPRSSSFLSKVMTSLLSPPHKRSTLQCRPALPYRKWEAELRRRVQGWYRSVGGAEDQVSRAEHLGLSHQFFWAVGETNPLEETPFHLLPFNRRVWLLKGLCDHVYETQKDVQDAVLGQPIHECRESVLGYDGRENAYIHFPHFCGADLRIYCQTPCLPMEFPLPSFHVKRSEEEPRSQGSEVKVNELRSVDGVKVENDSAAAEVKEEEERRYSSIRSQHTQDSGGVPQAEDLRDENESSDREMCFRVGDGCYEGKSPALASPQHLQEKPPCTECSEASTRRCSHWNHSRPEINRRKRDRSKDETPETRPAKRKKKSELNARKTITRKLKNERMKKRVQRAANRTKKHKLRKVSDSKTVKRRTGSSLLPLEPSSQLVCSSLDDLRRLISRCEDELDDLNSTKKRSGRWPHKRSTVKELHITLIRLLNELLPWEPKLVKAFQKNRARLKKECDDFRKHPEYENFMREEMDTADAEEDSLCAHTTGEVTTLNEDSEAAAHVNELVNYKSRYPDGWPDVIMSAHETGPFTRASKRRHGLLNEDLSALEKTDSRSSSSPSVETSDHMTNTQPSERCSVLSVPRLQGTHKPIQALLARSVGNKVTLINHPSAALMAQRAREENTTSAPVTPVQPSATCSLASRSHPVSTVTSQSTGPLVYTTAGGVGLLQQGGASVNMSTSHHRPEDKQVVILPSNLLSQSTERHNTTAGFTMRENKVPVQQVAPLKDTGDITTPVSPTLRAFPTTAGHTNTTEPKQELRTVCIRDSQSILVTTRGGNTGVVKVQTSEKNRSATLPHSSAFTISPQLQAFLVSKTSTSVPDSPSPTSSPPIKNFNWFSSSSVRTETSSVTCSDSSSGRRFMMSNVQTSVSKCVGNPPQEMPSDQSTHQKVFLLDPSSNITSSSAAGVTPGSRVMFVNHPSVANNSTLSVPKGVSNLSPPALNALKMIPNLKTSFGSSAAGPVMNMQSFSFPGLNSRMLSARKTEVSTKTTPVTSTAADKRHDSRSSDGVHKTAASADGKTFTFSTLGTGHMASSELLCVVKDPFTSPVLNILNNKSGFGSDSPSSFSGSLMSKHTTKLHVMSPPSSVPHITPVTSHQTSVQTGSSSTSCPPVITSSEVRSVQEKIVINTSAPLAPGTQLLINNTRFLVPPRGLATGTHVLLISSSCPSGGLGSVPPRGLNASVPSVVQGTKVSSQVTSGRVCQQTSPSHTLPAGVSSDPSLASVVRLPVFQTSDLTLHPSPSPSGASTSVVCSRSQGRLLSTTSALLQSPVISQNAPVMTRAPMRDTLTRMQNLPVATVPPIGCPVTPVATVPPSVNSVLMTPRQPIRGLQPGTLGKPIVSPQLTQSQSTSALHMTRGSFSKLLLNPDGAVRNIIQTSSDTHVTRKATTAQVNHPITRVTVADDPLRSQTQNPERLDH
ncbi:hypothetical protein E1301_Tti022542 [Triplophysa tibetana]|uniref:Bromo domain-containing protein n=1 Tax=Triplophysa tibetana TaxID=1572043 RepID=A0A5A9PB48_9TELE|nr:hypothetical protein E1301_Tti022542 [Triplophysa tibetana]